MDTENKAEFDRFAEEYDALQKENLGVFGKDLSVFSRYKVELAKHLLLSEPQTILEFGCGVGRNIPHLIRFFPGAQVYGCDTSEKSLELAASNNPQAVFSTISKTDDLENIYEQGVEFIFVTCVLHHISESEQLNWLEALFSILKPGGHIVIFEHNPYNPLTRHMFNTCSYDADAKLVTPGRCHELLKNAGFDHVRQLYTLFFMWRTNFWTQIERALFWLPLGGQYCVVARRDKI